MKPRVQIVDHTQALLIGSTGVIIESDFLPYNIASRQTPLVDVRLDGTDYVTSAFLDQLRLIGFEESAEHDLAADDQKNGDGKANHPL